MLCMHLNSLLFSGLFPVSSILGTCNQLNSTSQYPNFALGNAGHHISYAVPPERIPQRPCMRWYANIPPVKSSGECTSMLNIVHAYKTPTTLDWI